MEVAKVSKHVQQPHVTNSLQCCYCKQRLDDPGLKVYPGDPDDVVS